MGCLGKNAGVCAPKYWDLRASCPGVMFLSFCFVQLSEADGLPLDTMKGLTLAISQLLFSSSGPRPSMLAGLR